MLKEKRKDEGERKLTKPNYKQVKKRKREGWSEKKKDYDSITEGKKERNET